MFNQLITTFQGFFSRAYWFGSFLPVAVVAGLHLLLLELAFPATANVMQFLEKGFADTASTFTLFFVALVILAYALTPITPLVRGWLDGRLMQDWLHDHLRKERITKRLGAHEALKQLWETYARFASLSSVDNTTLPDAAAQGDKDPVKSDQSTVATARASLETIEQEVARKLLPNLKNAQKAFEDMKHALETNSSRGDTPAAKTLDALHRRLITLLDEATEEAQYRYDRADARTPSAVLRPTRIGDTRQATEAYCETVYKVDFDYLWPRIQMLVLAKTDDFATRLGDAEARLNFAVLTLALMASVPLVWFPVILSFQLSLWLFLGVAVVSPILMLFLREMVVQSQNMLGSLVRVAVDKYRLRVLTEIAHQPMPNTLEEERRLWEALMAVQTKQDAKDFVVLVPHSEAGA